MVKELRWCADIGMFACDRPIPVSCVHATDYCRARCYNCKLYKLYPNMARKDRRNEAEWQSIDGAELARALDRKKHSTDRFRLMTRGEALATHSDVDRVADIARANPGRLIWCPTRAWRDPLLRARIETELFPIGNLSVLASLDPSNTEADRADLASAGWSTMFFGRASDGWAGPVNGFRCPKTHKTPKNPKGIKGHCADCKAGCFAPVILGRRVDVDLGAPH
jgi:hypothetical protein